MIMEEIKYYEHIDHEKVIQKEDEAEIIRLKKVKE